MRVRAPDSFVRRSCNLLIFFIDNFVMREICLHFHELDKKTNIPPESGRQRCPHGYINHLKLIQVIFGVRSSNA